MSRAQNPSLQTDVGNIEDDQNIFPGQKRALGETSYETDQSYYIREIAQHTIGDVISSVLAEVAYDLGHVHNMDEVAIIRFFDSILWDNGIADFSVRKKIAPKIRNDKKSIKSKDVWLRIPKAIIDDSDLCYCESYYLYHGYGIWSYSKSKFVGTYNPSTHAIYDLTQEDFNRAQNIKL
jgi:hypothetical protein